MRAGLCDKAGHLRPPGIRRFTVKFSVIALIDNFALVDTIAFQALLFGFIRKTGCGIDSDLRLRVINKAGFKLGSKSGLLLYLFRFRCKGFFGKYRPQGDIADLSILGTDVAL